MNAHEVPDLRQLAEPYQVPGVLPDGISVSVALIANTPTDQLKEAANDAALNYWDADRNSQMDETKMGEHHYKRITEIVGDGKRGILTDAQEHAAKLQDEFGMYGSLGYDPTAKGLEILMGADQRVADAAAEVADLENYPAIVEAREELIGAMTKRAEAEMELPTLLDPKELSNEIASDITRLSRRGRIGSAAAGLILGAGAALGLLAGSSDEMPKDSEATIATALIGSTAGIGAIVGTGAGTLLTNRFARRRAQSIVRKAEAKAHK